MTANELRHRIERELRCRICLKFGHKPVSLFEKNGVPNYAQTILNLLNVEVEDSPNWPSKICSECINFLNQVLIFRNKILTNHQVLFMENNNRAPLQGRIFHPRTMTVLSEYRPPVIPSTSQLHPSEAQPPLPQLRPLPQLAPLPTHPQETPLSGQSDPPIVFVDVKDEIEAEELPDAKSGYEVPLKEFEIPEEIFLVPEKDQETDIDLDGNETGVKNVGERDENERAGDGKDEDEDEDDPYSFLDNVILNDEDSEREETAPPRIVKEKPKPKAKRAKTSKPKATPLKEPKINLSVVRQTCMPTEEEFQLEAIMVEMGLFICKLCQLDCKTYYALRKHHVATHEGEVYEICCDKSINIGASLLYDHIRYHLDKDVFNCKQCDAKIKSSHSLNTHVTIFHKTDPNSFICDVCGKGSPTEKIHRLHKQMHELVECPYCGKKLGARSIEMHIKEVHELEVNFLCDLCGRGFSSLSRLNNHILDHGGPHGGRRRKTPKAKQIRPNIEVIEEYYLEDYYEDQEIETLTPLSPQ